MNYPLREKLENCLNVLLKQMEGKGMLPKGYDSNEVIKILMESLNETFKNEVPQDIFKDPTHFRKLMILVYHAVQLSLDPELKKNPALLRPIALSLARAFFDPDMSPEDRAKALKTAAGKIAQPFQPDARHEQVTQEGLSEIQLFCLQMLGIAMEGLSLPLQYIAGNAVGATDNAVKTGSGSVGWKYAMDSLDSPSISAETKATIATRFESLLSDAIEEMNPHFYHSPRPSIGTNTAKGGH